MITPEQRELRRKYIGSSDAPAILGLDPYRSAADVWLDKTGKAADFAGNEATDRGNLLEPVLVKWAERAIGMDLIPNVFQRHADLPLACNLDAASPALADPDFVVEAKTSVNVDEWGEPGTDQVPERVIVQTHHAMFVTGYRLAYVPVLLPLYGRFEFRMYRVERDDALADAIAERCAEFHRRYVLTGERPDDFRPSLETLRRVRREPNKIVPLADDLADAYVVAKAAYAKAKEECDAAQAALLAAMGDAEAGACRAGTFTYMESKRAGYTVEPSTYRQLRFRKAK